MGFGVGTAEAPGPSVRGRAVRSGGPSGSSRSAAAGDRGATCGRFVSVTAPLSPPPRPGPPAGKRRHQRTLDLTNAPPPCAGNGWTFPPNPRRLLRSTACGGGGGLGLYHTPTCGEALVLCHPWLARTRPLENSGCQNPSPAPRPVSGVSPSQKGSLGRSGRKIWVRGVASRYF